MAAPALAPVTRQVSSRAAPALVPSGPESVQPLAAAVAELPVLDASGRRVPFGTLFRDRRAVVIFVRVSLGGGAARSWDLARRLGWKLLPTALAAGAHLGPQSVRVRVVSAGPFPLSSTRGVLNAKRSCRFL